MGLGLVNAEIKLRAKPGVTRLLADFVCFLSKNVWRVGLFEYEQEGELEGASCNGREPKRPPPARRLSQIAANDWTEHRAEEWRKAEDSDGEAALLLDEQVACYACVQSYRCVAHSIQEAECDEHAGVRA